MNISLTMTTYRRSHAMPEQFRMFRGRLSNGQEVTVKAEWDDDAEWFVARHEQTTLYFDKHGNQV
ncbi:hypothetical protein OSG_eHP15_00215 [environmental Halophage eHP-15]|nr:hypothetical protein OSG_eHP15_00215 [environmental Halophage eHP-15]